jgi:hypothetical protein
MGIPFRELCRPTPRCQGIREPHPNGGQVEGVRIRRPTRQSARMPHETRKARFAGVVALAGFQADGAGAMGTSSSACSGGRATTARQPSAAGLPPPAVSA